MIRCKGRVVTVEDHYPEGTMQSADVMSARCYSQCMLHYLGGIGEAVAACLTDSQWQSSAQLVVRHARLAVDRLPRSGPPDVLIDMFGIGAHSIQEAVNKVIN